MSVISERILLIILLFVPIFLWGQPNDSAKFYENPIFAGDYPDPSVFRDGDDYYMTHSSFEYYPGLLIWHSKDLVNWEPVCRALTKYVGSVWAPDFFKYNNKYYIYFPADGKNYVITADKPEGPWSNPIDLNVGQIDPGHIVDADGERYLHLSGGYVVNLNEDGLSTKGEVSHVYDGWDIPNGWDIACKCLEGPKLTFHNGYYYLTTAEGGTVGPATAHMVVSARSKTPVGPWENSPYNPIVHTYNKDEKWHAKGHGTLVEDKSHNWWVVYHAYEKDYYTLGRQTLMEPIEWTSDGWFKVPDTVRTDLPISKKQQGNDLNPISLSDNFEGDQLGIQWTFFKDYEPARVKISDEKLYFEAKGDDPGNSSPLLCVPKDESYEFQVKYEIKGNATGGLVLYYNKLMYAGFVTDGEKFTIYRRALPLNSGQNKIGTSGYLKIKNIANTITFYFSTDGENWQKMTRSFVVSSYNHTAFGDFLALRIGLVSLGEGAVGFSDFVYSKIE